MLGPPGSGKGTYAKAIAGLLRQGGGAGGSLPVLSTGDLLRDEISRGSALGAEAQRYADRGLLVPDAVVIDAVLSRLDRGSATEARPDGSDSETSAAALRAKLEDAEARYESCSKMASEAETGRRAAASAAQAYEEAESLRQPLLR